MPIHCNHCKMFLSIGKSHFPSQEPDPSWDLSVTELGRRIGLSSEATCAQQLQYTQSSLPFSPLPLHARRSFFRRKRTANVARKTSAAASSTCLWDVHKPQGTRIGVKLQKR